MLYKREVVLCLAFSLLIFAAGCKKKAPVATAPPPPAPTNTNPPPAPAAPVVDQFTAEPSNIQRGESSTLRWQVSGNTTNISINNGIGTVQSAGNQTVRPSDSTTYTLTATGPGGTVTGVTTISITSPPPPPPPPPPSSVRSTGTLETRVSSELQDAYFDYDKNDIRPDARDTLSRDAAALRGILADFPNASVVLEGHCDERGSAEYNLGLGDRRASSAKEYLVELGVPGDRIRTISYGKERPVCTDATEECWQKNRRVHFSPGQ
jgi:peptidoglycan-associated lipoprotein